MKEAIHPKIFPVVFVDGDHQWTGISTSKTGTTKMVDGVEHFVRSALHQVREPHQDSSFPQTYGVVQICKREELDFEFRKRRSRPQLPIGLFKKNRNSGVHRIQISTGSVISSFSRPPRPCLDLCRSYIRGPHQRWI